MKIIEKSCENRCPKCNSDNVDWQSVEVCDGFVVYPGSCSDCDISFSENHKLVYEITTFNEDE